MTSAEVTMGFVPMKTDEYVEDIFLLGIVNGLPFFIFLTYIAPLFRMIGLIVAEKESKVILLTLIELDTFKICRRNKLSFESKYKSQDTDVINEENRVKETDPKEFSISASNLRKVYRIAVKETVTAIEKVSFGLDNSDCFALLGTNEAGKTTTFKLLTHDELPTFGEIFVKGKELRKYFTEIRKLIGLLSSD